MESFTVLTCMGIYKKRICQIMDIKVVSYSQIPYKCE